MMKVVGLITLFFAASVVAFAPQLSTRSKVTRQLTKVGMGYVPAGFTPEQWKKKQEAEKVKKQSKNFGAYGPQGFQSRSLQSFQQDLEKGKAGHLMPVFNAREKMKSGQIKKEDIPYMQRGGNWDNSDVKGAKKKSWNASDKKYKANPTPNKVDWSSRNFGGGTAKKTTKNTKQPQKQQPKPDKPKLFGLF
mmetsp:Transcript_20942/g.48368  ORF Transcript_20942/g.48368 Transcript_20942/m.48368 type:complete len:191 (+) Transcript_20942:122-694(+)